MSGLPAGWVIAQISDLSVKCKQRKPDDDEEINYIDIGSIDRILKKIVSPQILVGKNAPSRARKVVEKKDVLVSLTRPNLNAVAFVPDKLDGQFASTGFEVIRPVGVENRYIFALVRSQDFINGITKKVQGALYPAAKSIDVRSYKFPLPPLNEQIRIANKLDSLLGKLQATQKRLDKIPTLLKRYRQSVLAAAVSGELTKEWRENRESEWTKINFNELIKDSANGLSKRKGDTGEPIVVLRLADFKNGKRKKGIERKIQLSDKERNKYALKCDDILVIRVNGSVDLAGLFIRYESNIEEIYCDHFIRFRLDKNLIDSDFMTYVANSGDGRRYLKSKLSTSAGQNTINQTSIKSLSFLLPKIKEQKQIVKRVEALFKLADQAEQHYQAAKQRSDKLTQSILAKAFRGELVPQDPNDEPASELLARIQAEKDK